MGYQHLILGLPQLSAQRSVLAEGMLVLGVVLVVGSAVMVWVKRKQGGATESITPHEGIERLDQRRGMRSDLETLAGEIEGLSLRFDAQINRKTAELKTLLSEADRRIAELRQFRDRVEQVEGPSGLFQGQRGPAFSRTGATRGSPETEDPLAKTVHSLADQGLAPEEIARRLGEHVGKVELILALRRV